MILVDTNVLIAVARTGDPKIVGLLSAHGGAVCGVTRAELLHGVRTAAERAAVLTMLGTLSAVPIPEPTWDAVGDNLNALRAGGVTIPFPDAVIATVAIVNDLELWTHDAHFSHVARVLPSLKLFTEPP
jgi:predicted nucleic acid-binding protein